MRDLAEVSSAVETLGRHPVAGLAVDLAVLGGRRFDESQNLLGKLELGRHRECTVARELEVQVGVVGRRRLSGSLREREQTSVSY